MKKARLTDEYKVAGFRPNRTLVDEQFPGSRIVVLGRRQKKVFAPIVEARKQFVMIKRFVRHATFHAVRPWSTFAFNIVAFDVHSVAA
jgi:hypothetical protein